MGLGTAGLASASLTDHHGKPNPPAEGAKPEALAGTVTAVAVGSFTLQSGKKPPVTVDVTTTTTYVERDVTTPTLLNVLAGDRVVVRGEPGSTSGTFAATSVRIIPPPTHAYPGVVKGLVTVTGGGNGYFTIVRGEGKKTFIVDFSSFTTYTEKGVTSPTIANVTAGEKVVVRGTASWPKTTVNAKSVHIVNS
jgi:hypothetical protein